MLRARYEIDVKRSSSEGSCGYLEEILLQVVPLSMASKGWLPYEEADDTVKKDPKLWNASTEALLLVE